MDWLEQIDFMLLDSLQQNLTSPIMDWLMPLVSRLSDFGEIWILIALIMLIYKKYRRDGITISLAIMAEIIICNGVLKHLFQRIRPFNINTAVNLLIDRPNDFSFPSGHTMLSFTAATVIFSINRKWGIAAYFLASLIGFSRLYLYVHFPSDVIFGALLGVAIAIIVVYMRRLTQSKCE